MNHGQKTQVIANLTSTSVEDVKCSLNGYSDPGLLCDLLIHFSKNGQLSKEKAVRTRISKLIKGFGR